MYNEFSHYFLDVFLSPLKKKLIRYLIMAGLLKWKSFERNTSLNKNLNHFSEMFYWGIVITTPIKNTKPSKNGVRTLWLGSTMILSVCTYRIINYEMQGIIFK